MKTGDTVAWVLVDNHGNVLDEQFETRAEARAAAKTIMMAQNRGYHLNDIMWIRIARVVIEK